MPPGDSECVELVGTDVARAEKLGGDVERAGGVLLVDQPHQPQVLGGLRRRLVVEGRPAQPEQLALAADAQVRVVGVDQGSLGFT